MDFPCRAWLNDEALRDGLQSPSVLDPPIEKKLRILHLMEALGAENRGRSSERQVNRDPLAGKTGHSHQRGAGGKNLELRQTHGPSADGRGNAGTLRPEEQ